MRVILAAGILLAVTLAGCAEDAPDPEGTVDPETFEIEEGKGSIAGLLVDDRFRPLQVASQPAGAEIPGFVLLQETGEQVGTNADGEFVFVDIEPGTYTIRVTAEGYEATPEVVRVEEGVFNDASIMARRVLSDDGFVISEEYAAFIPCQESAAAQTSNYCSLAFFDASGDTSRDSFITNYTDYNVTSLVVEFLTNKEADRDGAIKLVMRNQTHDSCYVANDIVSEGNYLKVWLKNGEISPFDLETRNCPWTNEQEQSIEVWAQGVFREEAQVAVDAACTVPICVDNPQSRGIGIQPGVAVKILVTAFVGDPEGGVENYCGLCGDA